MLDLMRVTDIHRASTTSADDGVTRGRAAEGDLRRNLNTKACLQVKQTAIGRFRDGGRVPVTGPNEVHDTYTFEL